MKACSRLTPGRVLILCTSLVSGAFMVMTSTSDAKFTASTAKTSSFGTGSVSLSDDDAGSAAFALTNLRYDTASVRCIRVTYGGSLSANVRLFATVDGGTGLGTYARITVERGTGGTFANCSGFVLSESLFTGTVAGLAATASGFVSGLGSWAPAGGSGASSTYRLTVSVEFHPSARNKSTQFTVWWEARNV